LYKYIAVSMFYIFYISNIHISVCCSISESVLDRLWWRMKHNIVVVIIDIDTAIVQQNVARLSLLNWTLDYKIKFDHGSQVQGPIIRRFVPLNSKQCQIVGAIPILHPHNFYFPLYIYKNWNFLFIYLLFFTIIRIQFSNTAVIVG
jgi:hypothetical protein